jgi:phosphoribosylglycinamide formyltransferase 1
MNIIVLISGNGSNLQAIIDAAKNTTALNIQAVISNRPDAYGLKRAGQANLDCHCIDHTLYISREEFDNQLAKTILTYHPDLVVLAGFMRILGPQFIRQFPHRIVNIHPSLLPKYPGLNTHQRALENNDSEHGSTIHYVTDVLDAGPIIARATLSILPSDTPHSLEERIKALEHQLYPDTLIKLANKISNKSQS